MLRLRMGDLMVDIFRSARLIGTEFRLFYNSRFKGFEHFLTALKAHKGLLGHLLRLLPFVILRMFSVHLFITYYILGFAYYALHLAFAPNFTLDILMLRVGYICLAYCLCVFLYLLWSADDHHFNYDAPDLFLHSY